MTNSDDQIKMIGIDPLDQARFLVRKRDGRNEEFNEARIHLAIESAFKSVQGIAEGQKLPDSTQGAIKNTAGAVAERVLGEAIKGMPLEVERIQDAVEEELMRAGHLKVARCYILYREERRRARVEREKRAAQIHSAAVSASPPASPSAEKKEPSEPPSLKLWAGEACRGLEERCPAEELARETWRRVRASGRKEDLENTMARVLESRLTNDPAWDTVAARFLSGRIYRQALPEWAAGAELEPVFRQHFPEYINEGVYLRLLAPAMADFDLERLAGALRLERDAQFSAAGLQALSDHFLLRDHGRCLETPQYFWMRLAMGLALSEGEQAAERALEFYEALSSFAFVPSAPILFNAGTAHPHLAVCYAASGWNDLEHITTQLGGRMSAHQRTGLTCSWLEPWHLKFHDFLARPLPGEEPWHHDLNKGAWIPDLFMKRVREKGRWTLFDPAEVPDLHELFGRAFEQRYVEYEKKAARGEIKEFRQIEALELWHEILASLAETGQPWLAFKDAANLRSSQDHTGVVRSGNLCSGILLNTPAGAPAVCALGAINLAAHIEDDGLDAGRLSRTAATAIRMLDNALDLSAYPSPAARESGREHRAVGLGITGFQEALYQLRLGYGSAAAAEFADRSMEAVSYHAILASSALARERGGYASHPGSKWSHGLLPADTLAHLEEERGRPVIVDRSGSLDWTFARQTIRRDGLRHGSITAVGPSPEGSLIAGVTDSIELARRPLFGQGAGGRRRAWNLHLVEDLKRLNLWDNEMMEELRRGEYSIQPVARIPQSLKEIYRTAFEIEPHWLVECAARRQKWIDLGQPLTLYAAEADLGAISEIYLLAWEQGLKSTRQLCLPELEPGQKQPDETCQVKSYQAFAVGQTPSAASHTL
jgi:ribonucleoside-diphosphate reductase alpha chain